MERVPWGTEKMTKHYSVCSAHQKPDPTCPTCKVTLPVLDWQTHGEWEKVLRAVARGVSDRTWSDTADRLIAFFPDYTPADVAAIRQTAKEMDNGD